MVNVDLLQKYISSGLNILVTGQAGTGKTTMIKEAASRLNMSMKYYSTSTLDPFADLIGIPVPNHGQKTIDYYRPRELDKSEIIFFDELNRADLMVLNAVFEIIQFRSINGEKLDRLKCVVAAINPVEDGYATRELDIALMDRFDIYLEADPNPSWPYFKSKYGENYARVGLHIFQEYNQLRKSGQPLNYLSPRRLDKILSIFHEFPVVDTLRSTFPSRENLDFVRWANLLSRSMGRAVTEITGTLDDHLAQVESILKNPSFIKDGHKVAIVSKVAMVAKNSNHSSWPYLKKEFAASLNKVIKSMDDFEPWVFIIEEFGLDELETLTQGWPMAKALVAKDIALGPA